MTVPKVRFVQTLEVPNLNIQLNVGDSISFLLPSSDGFGAGRFIGWIVRLWKSSVLSGCVVSVMLQVWAPPFMV